MDPRVLEFGVDGVEISLEGVCAFPSREELASVVRRCCSTGGTESTDAAYGARIVVAGVNDERCWCLPAASCAGGMRGARG